jgi:hypothetical protein
MRFRRIDWLKPLKNALFESTDFRLVNYYFGFGLLAAPTDWQLHAKRRDTAGPEAAKFTAHQMCRVVPVGCDVNPIARR